MTTFKTIVTGTDFSSTAEIGVNAAIQTAKAFGTERLHVVSVISTSQSSTIMPFVSQRGRLEFVLDKVRPTVEERLNSMEIHVDGVEVTREVRVGVAAQELSSVADSMQADLIVMASHGYTGIRRLALGSVASSVIRTAHCPVLIVGEQRPGKERYGEILAAVDLSPVSSRVLANAIGMAKPHSGTVHALSMYEHPVVAPGDTEVLPWYLSASEMDTLEAKYRDALNELVNNIAHDDVGVSIQVLRDAPPPQVILEVAGRIQADLVVLGTSGHNAWQRTILGSTAYKVIAEAQCPVLVVPHDTWAHEA